MSEKKEPKQLSEAEILQLHRESNPADEQYKGKPVDNESEEPAVVQFGGYDLNAENLESAQIEAGNEDLAKAKTEAVAEKKAKPDESTPKRS